MADVCGALATLLVQQQTTDTSKPELGVVCDGQKISGLFHDGEVVQLSADTHLFEVRLPEGAARLEITIA